MIPISPNTARSSSQFSTYLREDDLLHFIQPIGRSTPTEQAIEMAPPLQDVSHVMIDIRDNEVSADPNADPFLSFRSHTRSQIPNPPRPLTPELPLHARDNKSARVIAIGNTVAASIVTSALCYDAIAGQASKNPIEARYRIGASLAYLGGSALTGIYIFRQR